MTALLERADQAISATDFVRGFSSKLKELSARTTDHLVVFKDNQPALVVVNVEAYQEMLDELETLRVEAVARDRLATFDPATAVSLDEMRRRFGGKD